MKNRIIGVFFIMILCLSFVACASSNYKNDVAVKDLSDAAMKTVSISKGYFDADEDVFKDDLGGSSDIDSYIIKISNDAQNINEYGVFHAKSQNAAKSFKNSINDYISKKKNNSWYEQYVPNEIPKLNAAEARVYGNYVVYAIIPESQKTAFFGAIEELLNK